METWSIAMPMPTTIADYEIAGSLGAANNGRFLLARPPERLGVDAEFVVLKVFPACSERAYELSLRELRASAAVDSPHLVRVYDAVLSDTFALATEYLPLGTLAKPTRDLTPREVLTALRDAARGAHALHEAGLVHGDIKPANVGLAEQGGAVVGKLSDLGLAHVLDAGSTMSGMASPEALEYVDPAILEGERPSRLTEVWALGATIHRALAGTGIYGELQTGTPLLAIRRVLSAPPEINAGLDEPAATLIRDCLAGPQSRIQVAATVADRLDALLGAA
ncbi:MAG: protein kinase domain-containing protein [Sporichthyaceae bacterium]